MATQPADSSDRTATVLDGARPLPAPDGLAPRKRGRPPGLPKTGGRTKGVPNHTTADAKQMILARGKPIEFLCSIVQGQRVRVGPQAGPGPVQYEYPTLSDRMRAAMALAAKVLPDVKATELSGPDGAPIATDATVRTIDPFDTALRLSNLLHVPLRVGDHAVHVPDAFAPAAPMLSDDAPTTPDNGLHGPMREVARRAAFLLASAGHDLTRVAADFDLLPLPPALDDATPAADAFPLPETGEPAEAASGDPEPSAGMADAAPTFPPMSIYTSGNGWRVGGAFDVQPAGSDWQVTRLQDRKIMGMRPTATEARDYARHLVAQGEF